MEGSGTLVFYHAGKFTTLARGPGWAESQGFFSVVNLLTHLMTHDEIGLNPRVYFHARSSGFRVTSLSSQEWNAARALSAIGACSPLWISAGFRSLVCQRS